MEKSLIVELSAPFMCEKPVVDTIVGTLDAKNFAKLVDAADLKANPRDCRVGNITNDIITSLQKTPALFEHKTKGLLLACKACAPLERNRFRLDFSDPDLEGVLDGGHNLLAAALHILTVATENLDGPVRKVKNWEDLTSAWSDHRADIENALDGFVFRMPIEIKHAKSGSEGEDQFDSSILDISQARNNNKELAQEAKSNKAGHYEYLRDALDPDIRDEVEWKTNSGGRIKVRDLVALSIIPLSKARVVDDIPDVTISPVMIYSSKGKCLKTFESLMQHDAIAERVGSVQKLRHPEIKSALDLMRDLPRMFDWIYERFPDAYNKTSPGFGRIGSVRTYTPNKKAFDKRKHARTQPKTRFYQTPVEFDYPDGFIIPIVWSLSELIDSDGAAMRWKADPRSFFGSVFPKLMSVYHDLIKMAGYDPQKVGKSAASYSLLSELVRSNLGR